jgi:hypothetical protein
MKVLEVVIGAITGQPIKTSAIVFGQSMPCQRAQLLKVITSGPYQLMNGSTYHCSSSRHHAQRL